jgi:hypothetical protein
MCSARLDCRDCLHYQAISLKALRVDFEVGFFSDDTMSFETVK